MAEIETKTGFCALCRSRCGARFEVQEGRLTRALAAPDHPTGKALCTKGRAAPEILHNPDRLLYPMRRTAPKSAADPGWERVTWDEALRDIGARLSTIREESGAESVAFASTSPSGTAISDSIDWIERFIRGFGSPNTIYSTEICNWHKDVAHKFTTGSGILFPDYPQTDTILLWGFNPSAVWLDQATQIAAAKARGARVISVDPRRAGFAASADSWLRVRPGADGPLALGLLRLMLEQDGVDQGFLRRWTNAALLVRDDTGGFLRGADLGLASGESYLAWHPEQGAVVYDPATRQFAADVAALELEQSVSVPGPEGPIPCRPAFAHLRASLGIWTPERVSAVTGIEPEQIREAAQILSESGSVAYYCWSGVGQHRDATQVDRAIALLTVLKGRHDAPGGNVAYTKVPSRAMNGLELLTPKMLAPALGRTERPLGPPSTGWVRGVDVWRAVLEKEPYQVRGLMSFGANPAVSQAGGDLARRALERLEFHVHIDSVETPTARFADYLLPANTPWEREGLRLGFEITQSAESLVQLRQPALPSAGESLSDAEIVFRLAPLVGLSDLFFGGDFDRARDAQLAPSGLTLDDLRRAPEGITLPQVFRPRKYAEPQGEGQRGFDTETGLVEVYSALLQRHGQPPVPTFEDAPPEPRAPAFPYRLTTAKSPYYCHSQYRDIPALRRRAPEPQVHVHPGTALAEGLSAGDLVRLSTPTGEVRMTLRTDADLARDVVWADFGWWQGNATLGLPGYDPFSPGGANFNRLIDPDRGDPVSGSSPHRSMRCALAPAAPDSGPAWRGFRAAELRRVQAITPDCLRLELAVPGMARLPDYQPGQHIVLELTPPDGPPVIRCYSLVGAARDPARDSYAITVRRVPSPRADLPAGVMSGLIHDHLAKDAGSGTTLRIQAPRGGFILPHTPERPLVMVAGGIGITPFLSLLETLAHSGSEARIHLVEANRNGQSHPYRDRIAALASRLPGLSRVSLYDAPTPPDRAGQTHHRTGRVSLDDILPPDLRGLAPEVYHCGPPQMMAAVERLLAEAGHPPERIFSEAFGAPAPRADVALPKGPFALKFARSGRTLRWTPDAGSIMALAEANGVALPSGCRAGQCESCALTILSGAVQSTDGTQSTDRCLTCSAYPASDLTLDG